MRHELYYCIQHIGYVERRRSANSRTPSFVYKQSQKTCETGVLFGMGGMFMYDLDLLEHTDTVNELLARYGVKFGYLEKGLKQRVVALNLFLKDIYSFRNL